MNLQYISNAIGETTGVYIPITDWEKLKSKYADLENDVDFVPDWHKEIILERLKDYNENPDDVLDWDEVKDDFNFE